VYVNGNILDGNVSAHTYMFIVQETVNVLKVNLLCTVLLSTEQGENKEIIVPLYNVAISNEVIYIYIYMQSITNFLMNLYHTVNKEVRGINLLELI